MIILLLLMIIIMRLGEAGCDPRVDEAHGVDEFHAEDLGQGEVLKCIIYIYIHIYIYIYIMSFHVMS